MTLMSCDADADRATDPHVDGNEWQIRARKVGLTQRMLGRLIDRPENTISRQLRAEHGKVPGDLIAIIIAVEDMPPEARPGWMARVEEALSKRDTE